MLENVASKSSAIDIIGLKSMVDQRLRALVDGTDNLSLKPQLEYALLSPGKRLRPILLLLSTQAVGGELERNIPLALSIEALHSATLVHDDIIDRDQCRRGFPTVHNRWSVNDAILVGDALISLSILLASDYGPRIVKVIAETGLALSDGEYLETSTPLTTVTEAQYFNKIRGKSAALFKAATQCGAITGEGGREEVEALATFGERLGLAYQIRDDIEDLKGEGRTVPVDLRNGIPTLPTVHLYMNGSPRAKRLLEKAFGSDVSLDDYLRIVTELEEHGSFLYCEQRIVENIEAGCSALSVLKPSEAKNLLLDMFRVVVPPGYSFGG